MVAVEGLCALTRFQVHHACVAYHYHRSTHTLHDRMICGLPQPRLSAWNHALPLSRAGNPLLEVTLAQFIRSGIYFLIFIFYSFYWSSIPLVRQLDSEARCFFPCFLYRYLGAIVSYHPYSDDPRLIPFTFFISSDIVAYYTIPIVYNIILSFRTRALVTSCLSFSHFSPVVHQSIVVAFRLLSVCTITNPKCMYHNKSLEQNEPVWTSTKQTYFS